jgi:hypothetical protein
MNPPDGTTHIVEWLLPSLLDTGFTGGGWNLVPVAAPTPPPPGGTGILSPARWADAGVLAAAAAARLGHPVQLHRGEARGGGGPACVIYYVTPGGAE